MLILETFLILLAIVIAAVFYYWRDARLRRFCVARLETGAPIQPVSGKDLEAAIDPFPRRQRVIPGVIGLLTGLLLYFWWNLPLPFAAAFAAMTSVLGYLLESFDATRKISRIEAQLANAIDVIVGSLRAGSTLLAAVEASLSETPEPLSIYFRDVVSRIRIGVTPEVALRELALRVPLESFRLFSMTLAAQWWTGGSMASTLSRVGRTIRDRIEMSRRIRTQRVETELSAVGILLVSYVLALIVWRANPEFVVEFFRSSVGSQIAGFVIALQAAGIVWISRLSRIDY
jgi:tight adherence protein B